jgi:hypothetical protein
MRNIPRAIVYDLLRAYVNVAATTKAVHVPWTSCDDNYMTTHLVISIPMLLEAVEDSIRHSPEVQHFVTLLSADPELLNILGIEPMEGLTLEDGILGLANRISEFYFELCRFDDPFTYHQSAAERTAETLERDIRGDAVEVIGLAMLSGLHVVQPVVLPGGVELRAATAREHEHFLNGWSDSFRTPLYMHFQVYRSNALLCVRRMVPRSEMYLAQQFDFDDYVTAINLAVGDCFVIDKHFVIDSVLAARGHVYSPPTAKIILSPELVDAAEGARIAYYVDILKTSINRHRLDLAIGRLTDGVRRGSSTEALVDYMVGIESILTSREPGETTFKVSLRLAAFVGFDRSDSLQLLKELKRLYGVRSRILHGDAVSSIDADAVSLRLLLTRLIVGVLRAAYRFEPRYIEQGLLKALHRARRVERPLSIVLADVSVRTLEQISRHVLRYILSVIERIIEK